MPKDPKTLKDLRIEEELCEKLDSEVYLPVKKELKGCGRTYSLGIRKENFKGFLAKKFEELKLEAIKEIKLAESSIAKEATRGLFGWGTDFLFTKDVIGYIKWKFNIIEEDLKDG
ncbi:MAG: hypothetical protein E3J56_01105 [Candidatus Aminicenantes bacterium]|nr:MAG: hypothetical protein E3J56_01105 [Candidatus Aminicenantes bacterium]